MGMEDCFSCTDKLLILLSMSSFCFAILLKRFDPLSPSLEKMRNRGLISNLRSYFFFFLVIIIIIVVHFLVFRDRGNSLSMFFYRRMSILRQILTLLLLLEFLQEAHFLGKVIIANLGYLNHGHDYRDEV